jgi:hypothetical protein
MTDKSSLQIKPRGTCLKSCFYREGPYLHAIVTLVESGDVQIFKGSLDLRPIAAAVKRKHAEMHGTEVSGFFSSISHAVSSIGHAKILKSISNDIKSVAKSKAFGAICGATAIVFPPVGIPAAAAYAIAKTSIGVIEEANAVKAKVTQIANSGSAAARAAAHAKIPQIQQLMAQKELVQKKLADMATLAKHGNPEALAAQRIFAIVLRQHQGLKNRVSHPTAARGVPAMMITKTGRVVPGHYLEQKANKRLAQAILFDGKKILRGKYAAA